MKVFEDMKQAIVLLLSLSLSIGVAFSQSELVESPSGLIVEDLDVTQATLRWNNQTNVASWIVSYRVFQQEQSNQLTTSDTVAYLQELISGTRYLCSVRAIDINGDTTAESEILSFVTLGFDSDCPQVENLSIASMNSGGITVQWFSQSEASSWEVVCSDPGTNPSLEGNSRQTANFEQQMGGLTSCNRYQIAVRSLCSQSVSDWRYIYAKYLPYNVQSLPLQIDFENANDNINVGFINSATNAWEIGTATNASSIGSSALYISNDNGATNSCDNSTAAISYAYMDFDIPETAVSFYIDFKYKTTAVLQNAALKVFLVSPESAISIDQLPSANNQVGEAAYIGANNTWTEVHIELPSFHIGTTKRILFVWQNQDNAPSSAAVAIDDIYLTARYCATPSNLRAESVSSNSAILAWDTRDNQSSYNLEYKPTEESEWTLLQNVVPNSVFNNLQSATSYTFRVQADCSDEQSFWSDTAVFSTSVPVAAPSDLIVSAFDDTSATISWSSDPVVQKWLVELTNQETQNTNQTEVTQAVAHLGNLSENTFYAIRVRAVSITNDTSNYSSTVYVHTLCSPIDQFAYECNDTIKFANDGGFCFERECWRESTDTLYSPLFNLSASANPVLTFELLSEGGNVPRLLFSGMEGGFQTLAPLSLGSNAIVLSDIMERDRVMFAFQSEIIEDRDCSFKIANLTIKDTCLTPDNLTVNQIEANSAVLEWDAYSNNTSFAITLVNPQTEDTLRTTATGNSYTFEDLEPNTQYIVWFSGLCGELSANNFAMISFTTASEAQGCQTPTNFVCQHYQSKGDETIVCTWDDVEDNPYIQWEVNYKEAYAVNFSSATVAHYPRFTLRNLDLGSRWEFRVRAICSSADVSDWTEIQTVIVGDQGIDAASSKIEELKIYPNPATHILHVKCGTSRITNAQLSDANGRVVKAWDLLPEEIDISGLEKGYYFLSMTINSTRISRKISIQ